MENSEQPISPQSENWQKAIEYQNNDNKGEPKSERIRLLKLTLNHTQK